MTTFIPPATSAEIAHPAPEGQRHHQAVKIVCSLIGNGLNGDAVFAQVRGMYDQSVTDAELKDIIDWAEKQGFKPSASATTTVNTAVKSYSFQHGTKGEQPASPDPVSNVQAIIARYPELIGDSPVKPSSDDNWRQDAALLVEHAYRAGELINVVVKYAESKTSDGKTKYTPADRGASKQRNDVLEWLRQHGAPTGDAGAWIRMNPVTGEGVANDNVAAFRFALVESDIIRRDPWQQFIRRLPLPIFAMIDTGSDRAPHTWVAINATDADDYKAKVGELFKLLELFGLDRNNKNPSRLSRLPGAKRTLGGYGDGKQRLLYLNPEIIDAKLDLAELRALVAPITTVKSDALQTALSANRPTIQLPGEDRLLSDFATDLAELVADKDVFIRNGEVVVLRAGELKAIKPAEFRTWAEQYVTCYRREFGNQQVFQIGVTMSNDSATGVLSAPQFINKLRQIHQVNDCRLPVIRKDGSLALLPEGYDAVTQTLTLPVIDHGDDMPLGESKTIIEDLFFEFIFADGGRSKAVAIAAMVGLYCKHLLPALTLRPCFVFVANAEGAGKSLLVAAITTPTLGRVPTGRKADDDDEIAKLLLATVREARPVLFLDNLKGHLSSESLEAFLSAPEFEGRKLGVNEYIRAENLATLFITGNGLTVSPDMRRRSLFVELRLEVERAEDRVFQRPLDIPALLEMRPKLLAALWSLVRHWDRQGRPSPSRNHSAFPSWAKIIGGIIEAAGFDCPLETAEVAVAADPDGDDMRRLVLAMTANQHYIFSELVDLARKHSCFESIIGGAGELDRKDKARLGRLLGRYDRRLVANCRFIVDGRGHARNYRVEPANPSDLHGRMVEHGVSARNGISGEPILEPKTMSDHATMQNLPAEASHPPTLATEFRPRRLFGD